MANTTGGIRGQRNQSSCNGHKTLGSILASDSGNGAGSVRRLYGYYTRNNTVQQFYQNILNIKYGQYKDKQNLYMGI